MTHSMRYHCPAFIAKRAFPAFSHTLPACNLDFQHFLLSTFPAYHLHPKQQALLSAIDRCALTTLGLRSTSVSVPSALSTNKHSVDYLRITFAGCCRVEIE